MSGYGRGRRRGRRWITEVPETTYFRPFGVASQEMNVIHLTFEELETLRLVDLEGLTQEESAAMMGVSRKTLWNDLQNARKKVAGALVNGHAIRIIGENWSLRSQYQEYYPKFNKIHSVRSSYPATKYADDKTEEKAKQIFQLLPKTNCGACGYPSCIECARAIAAGNAPPDACQILGDQIINKVKDVLGEKEVK